MSYQSEVNLYLRTLIGRLCKYYFIGSEPLVKFLRETSQTVNHYDVITCYYFCDVELICVQKGYRQFILS